jgi:hypothetical protein
MLGEGGVLAGVAARRRGDRPKGAAVLDNCRTATVGQDIPAFARGLSQSRNTRHAFVWLGGGPLVSCSETPLPPAATRRWCV